jgi:predicted RND superfamily exporter protein
MDSLLTIATIAAPVLMVLLIVVLIFAARNVKVTGTAVLPAEQPTEKKYLELFEELQELTTFTKQLERRINDVDNNSEQRYRKIAAREKRMQEAEQIETELSALKNGGQNELPLFKNQNLRLRKR